MTRTTLLLVAVAATVACGGGRPAAVGEAREPVTLDTAVAALATVPSVVEATGTVEARARVSPGTKIMGRIERVPAREGDRVRAGQVLAVLEKRDLEAAVEQARAGLAMAEAQRENARAQHRRMEGLHERGSVTDKALEDAVAAFRVSEAAVRQAEANLEAARVNLGYAEIRSPVAGWVVAKTAEAGDMASPGTALFTVEDLSSVKVTVRVPEAEVVGLSEGDLARIRVDVLDEEWECGVDRVIPSGDRASRTYDVQFMLVNPDGRLKSGMFARARFERGSREALLVPDSAVVARGQLRGIFVVDEQGTARLRWVRLGRAEGGRVEVLSGLETGERFVVVPPAGFTDGTPVRTG